MHVHLHANARTTPKARAVIQSSPLSVAELAQGLGVSETTVRRWKGRSQVADRSNRRHDLGQSTTVTEEALIGELRRDLGLSLDDIVEVMHRCVNPKLSRSAIYRCLRRLGAAKRAPAARDAAPGRGRFPDAMACGFIHVDLKHLTRLQGRPAYVFVAIDRATRFVHIEIIERREGKTIALCLERFLAAFPHSVHAILTDNGSEFTDRFAVDKKGKPEGKPSGDHPFDLICKATGIEHRLAKPFHPQTNGMVERFNRRLAEALREHPAAGTNSGKNRFASHDERNAFLHRVVHAYNRTRLRCLDYISPIETLNNHAEHTRKRGSRVSDVRWPWVPAFAGTTGSIDSI
jgi:transposase InsO family protein